MQLCDSPFKTQKMAKALQQLKNDESSISDELLHT